MRSRATTAGEAFRVPSSRNRSHSLLTRRPHWSYLVTARGMRCSMHGPEAARPFPPCSSISIDPDVSVEAIVR